MYIVEGNIGAGKSTFLKLLAQKLPDISIVLEPSHNWQNTSQGQSLLSNFYQDQKRWAYTMETFIMICRAREHMAEIKKNEPNRIIERSIYSGHYCFAYNSYEQQFMNAVEWHAYQSWFNFLIPHRCKAPLGFIYLQLDPEVAYERIQKRARAEEKNITLEYLRQIHLKHELFLIKNKSTLPSISLTPVLILDCNEEFESNETKLQEYSNKVRQFISFTQQTFKPATVDWNILRQSQEINDQDVL